MVGDGEDAEDVDDQRRRVVVHLARDVGEGLGPAEHEPGLDPGEPQVRAEEREQANRGSSLEPVAQVRDVPDGAGAGLRQPDHAPADVPDERHHDDRESQGRGGGIRMRGDRFLPRARAGERRQLVPQVVRRPDPEREEGEEGAQAGEEEVPRHGPLRGRDRAGSAFRKNRSRRRDE